MIFTRNNGIGVKLLFHFYTTSLHKEPELYRHWSSASVAIVIGFDIVKNYLIRLT